MLLGRCLSKETPGAAPAQTPYHEVALEVSVFLMPPLYSNCATSTIATTELGETALDSPCPLSRALKKLLKSGGEIKNMKIILKRWHRF